MDQEVQVQNEKKVKKPIFKKWWFWVIIVFVVIIIIGAASGKSKDDKPSVSNETTTGAVEKTTTAEEQQDDAQTTEKKTEPAKADYEVGEGIVHVWENSLGSTWISASVPVKNTGSANLYLSSGTLDIEDATGKLITTLKMVSVYPQVLKPGETAYYYEENTLDNAVDQEGLKIIPHLDIDEAKVECVRFDVSETEVKNTDYFGVKVTGRVENTSDEAQNMVYVVAHLFDADGNLITQQFTILDNEIQPGEKIGFETSNLGYSFDAGDVASFEVFAFPIQYQF